MSRATNTSALKVLNVMEVLFKNFFHGYSPGELATATGYSASDITRYVETLIQAGWAERIEETGRIRPSVKIAKFAIQIMNALNRAEQALSELINRINRT
jgi:DNA-binding IclR family transcriptional regulator